MNTEDVNGGGNVVPFTPKIIIERLAKLGCEEYLSARKKAAEELGWPVKELDKLVKEKKKKAKAHLKVVPTQARGRSHPFRSENGRPWVSLTRIQTTFET